MDPAPANARPLLPPTLALGLFGLGAVLCAVAAVLFASRPANKVVRLWGEELREIPNTPQAIAEMGEALINAKNCNYCHRTDPAQPVDHPRINCQHCHQNQNIPDHLAPPIDRLAERRPADWVRRYLRYPYAIRERSPHRMPDLNLTDFEVEVAARYMEGLARKIAVTDAGWRPSDEPQTLDRGRELYRQHGCQSCHDFGSLKAVTAPDARGHLDPSVLFAPDLTHVARRVRPHWLVAAILKPREHMPWSGMTEPAGMTEDDARAVASFLFHGVSPPRFGVKYEQVQEIFNKRCTSCHYAPRKDASPAMNPGGGSGWLAVWGKAPRQLSLESHAQAITGSRDDLGRERLVIVPFEPNSPILYHLRGLKQPAMPLGHDPLPEDEIRLIERWILDGAREK